MIHARLSQEHSYMAQPLLAGEYRLLDAPRHLLQVHRLLLAPDVPFQRGRNLDCFWVASLIVQPDFTSREESPSFSSFTGDPAMMPKASKPMIHNDGAVFRAVRLDCS